MRLLKRNETGEISLTDYLLADLPPYAILSHTWGDEEISFRDMTDSPNRRKQGYEKIKFCADQAWQDGLQFCWVDTCCIDKSSSAELQEAINSMFRWYRDAAKCYVYLQDVSASTSDCKDLSREPTWLSGFKKSRWFTRGWTLQELIAPISVEFFSKDSLKIGTRKTLEDDISVITGIPVSALRGSPLVDFTIEARVAWMEKRETTRQEDKAYAMLGILNICMPLLYGEGRDNAFQRLLELANRDANPPSVSAAGGSTWDLMVSISFPEMHSRLHQIENGAEKTLSWFTGNESFLRWMESDADFLWVKGKPGSGKSTLMKHIVSLPNWNGCNFARHFITARGSAIEMSTEGVCRTLLHQLLPLCRPYLRLIMTEFQERQKNRGNISEGKWKWEVNELKEHLRQLLLHKETPHVYIFVDALDELGEVPATSLISYFSNIISRARSRSKPIHICVACREFPLIALDGLSISVDKHNSADISNYINSQAKNFAVDERYDEVLQFLRDKANGVFLWITLVLPNVLQLCRKRRQVADILKEVRKLPTDLHTLFQALLDGVPTVDQKRALRLFQWLCFVPVTLEASSLLHVVASIDGSQPEHWNDLASPVEMTRQINDLVIQITDMSCGLAELISAHRVYQEIQVAQLIHQSVNNYLLNGGLQRLDIASVDPRASACLYVMKSIGELTKTWRKVSIPTTQTPIDLWLAMSHVCDPLEGGPPLIIESAINVFEMWNKGQPRHQKWSLLHDLYHIGLLNSFDLYISRPELDINTLGDRDETMFFHAVSKEDILTAKKLVATGRVEINQQRDDGLSILLFLIYNCKPLSLVTWLLSCPGVDLKACRKSSGETGVHLAIPNARVYVVQLLLGLEPELATVPDRNGDTPTTYALKLRDTYRPGPYIGPSWVATSEDRHYMTKDPAARILKLLESAAGLASSATVPSESKASIVPDRRPWYSFQRRKEGGT